MAVSLWVSQARYPFHLRSSSWLFCSDSPEWRRRHMVTWFEHHSDTFGTFRAFITLRSQFHLHQCSQRALTEIVSKITPNLGLVLKVIWCFMPSQPLRLYQVESAAWIPPQRIMLSAYSSIHSQVEDCKTKTKTHVTSCTNKTKMAAALSSTSCCYQVLWQVRTG